MSELMMFVGGTGTQADRTEYPGVCTRNRFESVGLSSIMGANGAPLASELVTGDSVAVSLGVAVLTSPGSFAGLSLLEMAFRLVDTDGISSPSFYLITSNDNDTVTFSASSIDGGGTVFDGENLTWSIGGAGGAGGAFGTSLGIEVANDEVAGYGSLNSWEVLHNLSESATAAQTLDAGCSALDRIVFTGCIYDPSVVANNFVRALEVYDMPFIAMGANILTISGIMLKFRSFSITSSVASVYGVAVIVSGAKCLFEYNKVNQTDDDAYGHEALKITGAGTIARCNYIENAVTRGSNGGAAIGTTVNSKILDNFIVSAEAGIVASLGYMTTEIRGNIIVGNDLGNGIYASGGHNTRGYDIIQNTIHNFLNGISIPEGPEANDSNQISIHNNIIWGGDTGTTVGILYGDSATSLFFDINNNAIGNCDTDYDTFGDLQIDSKISLTANPFLNAGGSYALASDFKLNDTAGGALCRSAAVPNDLDLDGDQDRWGDVGALQTEPTGGGGGGGFIQSTTLGRLGIQEL